MSLSFSQPPGTRLAGKNDALRKPHRSPIVTRPKLSQDGNEGNPKQGIDFSKKTKTDKDGNFTLTDVPFGEHRIVAQFTRGNQKFKKRSDPIPVSTTEPEKKAGELPLESANNKVSGILRDADGNPVANAELTLWGEKFYTDSEGRYTTPPLPDSQTMEEIRVERAAGFETTTVVAPFTSDGDTVVETMLVAPNAENHPPQVWLIKQKAFVDRKPQPGETVTFWAVYYDREESDLSVLFVDWRASGGSFGSSTAFLPDEEKSDLIGIISKKIFDVSAVTSVEWTAPVTPGTYYVAVEVTDPQGLMVNKQMEIQFGGFVEPPPNRAPIAVITGPSVASPGAKLDFELQVVDLDGDPLTQEWSGSQNPGGFTKPKHRKTQWIAPSTTGTVEIRCVVSDKSTTVTATHSVVITDRAPEIPNRNPVVALEKPLNNESSPWPPAP